MSRYFRGWAGVRSFMGTRVAEQPRGALRYNIPKRYANDTGGHVKMTWDVPTGAELFWGESKTTTRVMALLFLPGLYLLVLPWRYEIGDLYDSLRWFDSENNAILGYVHYITELTVQRNRAWEFLRFNARPGAGMADIQSGRMRAISANGGWGVFDHTTGRPHHYEEKSTRLTNFLDNPFLEKRYIEKTQEDMTRIREIREELTQIRDTMMKEKGNMYKQVME